MMSTDHVVWLLLTGGPILGILRAYHLDRLGPRRGSVAWRTSAGLAVATFVVFATPWGLAVLAEGLSEAFPDLWAGGLQEGYRYGFGLAGVGAAVGTGLAVRRRVPGGGSDRRAAALAAGVALLVFLVAQYPPINTTHCSLFRDGLILEGFCAVGG